MKLISLVEKINGTNSFLFYYYLIVKQNSKIYSVHQLMTKVVSRK